jgi:hypothetical protein
MKPVYGFVEMNARRIPLAFTIAYRSWTRRRKNSCGPDCGALMTGPGKAGFRGRPSLPLAVQGSQLLRSVDLSIKTDRFPIAGKVISTFPPFS